MMPSAGYNEQLRVIGSLVNDARVEGDWVLVQILLEVAESVKLARSLDDKARPPWETRGRYSGL